VSGECGTGRSSCPTTRSCARPCTTACTKRSTSTARSQIARAIERGEIELHLRDTSEPSPLSHEILNSKPYTFLDDAPLEERRTRAVSLRRGLPVAAR
jgi:ATP-dependent Lhr-like helicase